jgi:hypothetical protein
MDKTNKQLISDIKEYVENYKGNTIEVVDGLTYSQYQTLRKIEFYYNSKYINGDKDKAGRIKPFYNIVKAKHNVAVRATDFNTKDITITSDKPHSAVKSMVFSHELYQWMKRTNYAKSLNKQSEVRSKYGGVLVKKCMEKGELEVEVVEWTNLVNHTVNIESAPIIEIHYETMVDMQKHLPTFNQKVTLKEASGYATKSANGKDKIDEYVIYEIHGEFPETYLDDKGDEYKYINMYVVVLGRSDGKQILLHIEEEKESPYKYLPWNDVTGRTLGVGVIEDGFEAQISTNDAILKQSNITEFASKVLFKSPNKSIGGNLTAYAESGDVIDTSEGDIDLLNTLPSSFPIFDGIIEQWNTQYERVSSTFAANTGDTMPSGTPFRQTLLLNQEANSFFTYRLQEMGIFQQEIMTDWVLPHLAKRINKAHILSGEFSPNEVKQINKAFNVYNANKKFTEIILEGKPAYQEDYDSYLATLEQNIISKPFLEIPEDYFKDFEPYVSVITTGEARNKATQLESLNTILTTVSSNPAILQDPVLSEVFMKLLEVADSGISPASIQELIGASKQKAEEQAKMQAQAQAPQVPQPTQ